MSRRGQFAGFKRLSGAQIGAKAIKVHVCRGCGAQYPGVQPAQCTACGRMDFARIDSKVEARWLAQLQLLEKVGKIKNLRTQVSFDLMTIHHQTGLPVKVAAYRADFVWEEDGGVVIGDAKGQITDVAVLKLRFMEAAGLPVRLLT